ncbi:MAG: hypothetical protein HKL84_04965 [Acidimicrobiaceae bacterium]|nr:hypothetical protein [Acidimicrobiaceae bacterium]
MRTAVISATLSRSDYKRVSLAAHTSGLLWTPAVDRYISVEIGPSPSKYDIQRFLTALPSEDQPLHAHNAEIIAHDLSGTIKT